MFFEAVEEGTKFSVSGDLDGRYLKLLKMIANRKIKQEMKKDMLKLKYIQKKRKEIIADIFRSDRVPQTGCSIFTESIILSTIRKD
jgi:hypothetical protein